MLVTTKVQLYLLVGHQLQCSSKCRGSPRVRRVVSLTTMYNLQCIGFGQRLGRCGRYNVQCAMYNMLCLVRGLFGARANDITTFVSLAQTDGDVGGSRSGELASRFSINYHHHQYVIIITMKMIIVMSSYNRHHHHDRHNVDGSRSGNCHREYHHHNHL